MKLFPYLIQVQDYPSTFTLFTIAKTQNKLKRVTMEKRMNNFTYTHKNTDPPRTTIIKQSKKMNQNHIDVALMEVKSKLDRRYIT